MSELRPVSTPRRHDLDALRAFAMLLGIALHGGMSFIPSPYDAVAVVHDAQTSMVIALFSGIVHGFRMQVFFLISGFFTAMLWRKRGLKSLLTQRFKRIVLPLVLGMVTIIPLTGAVYWYVSAAGDRNDTNQVAPAVSDDSARGAAGRDFADDNGERHEGKERKW